MRTRWLTIAGCVIGLTAAFILMMVIGKTMADNQTDRWRETCDALNAELIDTPKFYGCVRDGEVVYPQ